MDLPRWRPAQASNYSYCRRRVVRGAQR